MIKIGAPVKDVKITSNSTPEQIISALADSGGFESINMSLGLDILDEMSKNKECTKFLSCVGAVISTGLRGIICDMMEKNMFDIVITTCGALDHDLARSFADYNSGSFSMDDSDLAKQNIHRLGSVLVPASSYGPLIEEKMQSFLCKEYDSGVRTMSSADITRMIGKYTDKNSFLYWATKNDIPVIVPGIMDGAVGSQIWMFTQSHNDFTLDIIRDSELLSSKIFGAKKSGALMIGGGISKHHTLWWNQYRGGLDYALYLTTASEYDGSLSGALVREAVSWGKVTPNAKETTIHGEATATLPFLYAALLSRLENT